MPREACSLPLVLIFTSGSQAHAFLPLLKHRNEIQPSCTGNNKLLEQQPPAVLQTSEGTGTAPGWMSTGAIKLFLLNTSIQALQRQSASNWTALGCFKHTVLVRSEAIQAEGEHPPQGARVGNHLAPGRDSTWQETVSIKSGHSRQIVLCAVLS